MKRGTLRIQFMGLLAVLLLVGCGAPAGRVVSVAPTDPPLQATTLPAPTRRPIATPTASPKWAPTLVPTQPPTAGPEPTATARPDGLTASEAQTLGSLAQVDEYPLYTMTYQGGYDSEVLLGSSKGTVSMPDWGCSLFAALGETDGMLYGRNFDWDFSPALLLYTDPPGGYASVSMVDVSYLFDREDVLRLEELSLAERLPLLETPGWPFDGMNEMGLVVGMAAVPGSAMPDDAGKKTLSSLGTIRQMLDRAGNVDEALAIMKGYNIDWVDGPPLHYLIADRLGQAALVEFYNGEMVVLENEDPWHMATNHLRAPLAGGGASNCIRYSALEERLTGTSGQLGVEQAMDLLARVAQRSTQWSVVYGLSDGGVHVVMGGEYSDVDAFQLGP